MNLLEATTTLIDAVKTYAPEEDRTIIKAVKRMEKRLFVLQVRQAKARKRNRMKAFWQAMALFNGGAGVNPIFSKKRQACFICPLCRKLIFWGDFIRSAQISPGGRFESMSCPHCYFLFGSERFTKSMEARLMSMIRVCGDAECGICGETFKKHPYFMGHLIDDGTGRSIPWLRESCDGQLVKL